MSNALSPRRITHSLSTVSRSLSPDSNVVSTLSAKLWSKSQDLAMMALESDFIQGIKNGSLNPNYYGQYTIQDVIYCYHGLNDWRNIANKATHPDIKTFAQARVKSWESYTQELFSEWHIRNPTAINLSKAVKTYVAFESKIIRTYDPHYAAVVMLPCDRLWYWLATQIKTEATKPNVYDFWINENGSSDAGAKRLEQFIDAHIDFIDESTALNIYRTAMLGEVNCFRSAAQQTLID